MALTDTFFLFLFLPISLLVCLLDPRAQKYCLIVISLVFYACGSARFFLLFVIVLVLNTALAYLLRFVHGIDAWWSPALKKAILAAGITVNVGNLFFYKYFDFAFSGLKKAFGLSFSGVNLILPLGISFFTFKAISLLIDVYKGEVDLPANPAFPMLYLSFFGQIVSGPITDYNEFYRDYKPRRLRRDWAFYRIENGSMLYITGFTKKILIADMLGKVASETFSGGQQPSAAYLWLGALCYSLELYYDFSGYSDMAIGIGCFFGIHSEKNFDYPYTTPTVSRFWSLWHISLGRWFRKYVYFPLGGSRVSSRGRLVFNLFVVWLLTGIWHGANMTFIVWGLLYFAAITAEKLLNFPGRLRSGIAKALYRIPVLLFILLQWVIFNSKNLSAAFAYIGGMFTARNQLANVRAGLLLREYGIFIAAAVIFALPVFPRIQEMIPKLPKGGRIAAQIAAAGVLAVLFVISVSFVIAGNNNPFLYGNF